MTVRFAAARSPAAPCLVAKILTRKADLCPANDDDCAAREKDLFEAALREFAAHRMAAAGVIAKRAEQALAAKDPETFDWWLGVCRTLDRRRGRELAALAFAAGEDRDCS